jgi:hypothetical protein
VPGSANSYRPTALSFNSYGWKGAPQYNRADVPTRWAEGATETQRAVLEQQLAYEWLASEPSGSNPMGGWGMATNPPFTTDAAGRLLPQLLNSHGQPARILRGFIRRAEYDNSDQASKARLYFMYNPETITRDYVSYLDQGALDPFNTIYESGNLVAPPSYMDFSFSLFFDRQQEATNPDFPGVFVDYQFFDLVVRNVVPASDPNSMNGALPDNGVMMVNPRDITVVFSPQMTVQGRPSNARVSFTKFTHRMVPTRMTIDLTMRVTYFGPMKDMVQYTRDIDVVTATIPWWEQVGTTFEITNDDIKQWQQDISMISNNVAAAALQALNETSSEVGTAAENLYRQTAISTGGSAGVMSSIVDFAIARSAQGENGKAQTYLNEGDSRHQLWRFGDCSSFVWAAFANHAPPYAEEMGWKAWKEGASSQPAIDTYGMLDLCRAGKSVTKIYDVPGSTERSVRVTNIRPNIKGLQKGDLLFRDQIRTYSSKNHVAFFNRWEGTPGESAVWITHLGSPGKPAATTMLQLTNSKGEGFLEIYNVAYRPTFVGSGQAVNNGGAI